MASPGQTGLHSEALGKKKKKNLTKTRATAKNPSKQKISCI
jgi:hypothetical protein